jgi:hypothetical protein
VLAITVFGVVVVRANEPFQSCIRNDVQSAAECLGLWSPGPKPNPLSIHPSASDEVDSLDLDGSFWSNGPYNGVNAFSSEINTFGFITNRTADDFLIGGGGSQPIPFDVCLIPNISEVRATLLRFDTGTAQLEIWRDGKAAAGCGVPSAAGPCNEATPLFPNQTAGYPVPFTSTTSTQIGTSFGFPVREYSWPISPNLTLPPGKFWLMAAGLNGTQSQTFWGLSNGGRDGMGTEFAYQRGYFGGANWSQTAGQNHFAFDIDTSGCALRLTGVFGGLAMLNREGARPSGNADEPLGQDHVVWFTVTAQNGTSNMLTPEFTAAFGPGALLSSCSSSVGTCTTTQSSAMANFMLPPNGSTTIEIHFSRTNPGQEPETIPIAVTLVTGSPPGQTSHHDTSVTVGGSFSAEAPPAGAPVDRPVLPIEQPELPVERPSLQ